MLRLGHYSTGSGLAGFVLDRQGTPVKLRFDGSDEIVALTPEPRAAHGTRLDRDDGATLLRVDEDGGVTLFADAARDGIPAFLDQKASALALPAGTKTTALDQAERAQRRLQKATGLNIPVVLESGLDEESPKWAAMADAAMVAGLALTDVAGSTLGHDAVAKAVERVVIREAQHPAIALEGKTLVVSVVADKPIVGRPSSALIKSKLGDLL